MNIKQKLKGAYQFAKYLVETTKVEILAGAILGATIGGCHSYNTESQTKMNKFI